MKRFVLCLTALMFFSLFFLSFMRRSGKNDFAVIAYYSGDANRIDSHNVKKLTHLIYSFCHLKGNRLNVDDARDSATIKKLVSLKQSNQQLKVLLSLGGWGGCKECSPVFFTAAGRDEFAQSVKEINNYFKTDGIDLDWEYPAIEGHPGHPYDVADKKNFTALVQALRKSLGKKNEITFAAGGFPKFLEESIEWKEVMATADYVNLMSYDLVSGFSTQTGHHTPLYSNPSQVPSANNAIDYLLSIGVPSKKIVIGSATYARTWENVDSLNNGLYRPGKFKSFVPYRQFNTRLTEKDGYVFYRDSVSNAAYGYNAATRTFATFDDSVSIAAKTKYVIDKKLKGIMFWELTLDKGRDGLVDVIDRVKKGH